MSSVFRYHGFTFKGELLSDICSDISMSFQYAFVVCNLHTTCIHSASLQPDPQSQVLYNISTSPFLHLVFFFFSFSTKHNHRENTNLSKAIYLFFLEPRISKTTTTTPPPPVPNHKGLRLTQL